MASPTDRFLLSRENALDALQSDRFVPSAAESGAPTLAATAEIERSKEIQLEGGEAVTEQGRALIELDLVSQLQALKAKLDEVQGEEKSEVELLEDMMATLGENRGDTDGRILIVTHQLPITLLRDEAGRVQWRDTSGEANLSHVISAVRPKVVVWFGSLGLMASDLEITEEEKEDVRTRLREHKRAVMVPAFFTAQQMERWYQVYCLQILWPVFHYNELQISAGLSDPRYWQSYRQCNNTFAQLVKQEWQQNDLIWTVDFNGALLAVPAAIRYQIRDVRIGIFVHCPFPSTELFRAVPNKKELLEGMLGADIVGFHTVSYSRHFLSSCRRVLGTDTTMDSLVHMKHTTQVKTMQLGTDPEFWQGKLTTLPVQIRIAGAQSYRPPPCPPPCPRPPHSLPVVYMLVPYPSLPSFLPPYSDQCTHEHMHIRTYGQCRFQRRGGLFAELQTSFQGKKVILGVDSLDYIKGLPLKLLAFESLLAANPDMAKMVVLVQVAYPPMRVGGDKMNKQVLEETNHDYAMLQREVNELVGKINGRFGTIDAQPIFYINKCVHERASMVAQHPQCAAW